MRSTSSARNCPSVSSSSGQPRGRRRSPPPAGRQARPGRANVRARTRARRGCGGPAAGARRRGRPPATKAMCSLTSGASSAAAQAARRASRRASGGSAPPRESETPCGTTGGRAPAAPAASRAGGREDVLGDDLDELEPGQPLDRQVDLRPPTDAEPEAWPSRARQLAASTRNHLRRSSTHHRSSSRRRHRSRPDRRSTDPRRARAVPAAPGPWRRSAGGHPGASPRTSRTAPEERRADRDRHAAVAGRAPGPDRAGSAATRDPPEATSRARGDPGRRPGAARAGAGRRVTAAGRGPPDEPPRQRGAPRAGRGQACSRGRRRRAGPTGAAAARSPLAPSAAVHRRPPPGGPWASAPGLDHAQLPGACTRTRPVPHQGPARCPRRGRARPRGSAASYTSRADVRSSAVLPGKCGPGPAVARARESHRYGATGRLQCLQDCTDLRDMREDDADTPSVRERRLAHELRVLRGTVQLHGKDVAERWAGPRPRCRASRPAVSGSAPRTSTGCSSSTGFRPSRRLSAPAGAVGPAEGLVGRVRRHPLLRLSEPDPPRGRLALAAVLQRPRAARAAADARLRALR